MAIQKQLFNGFIPLREPLVCIPGKIEYNKGICEALKPTLTTPALYQEAGGVTFNYGSFLQNVIDFFIIAFVLFLVIKAYTFKLRPIKEGVPTTKECPFCCKDVAIEAIRFAFCTSRFEKASSSNSVLIKMD